MRNKLRIYILLMIIVPLGEFNPDPVLTKLNINLGSPIFFFFLLWSKRIKPVPAGILVGMSVSIFHTITSTLSTTDFNGSTELISHSSSFFYYLIFGLLFNLFKTKSFLEKPIVMVLIGTFIEIITDFITIIFNYYLSGEFITFNSLLLIVISSFFRSFLVISSFSFFLLREANIKESLQKKKNEEMLLVVSGLFTEIVQLKKLMKNAEETTRECYTLYRELLEKDATQATTALSIAGKVHEIKKDHQRVYSGLMKLKVNNNVTDLMNIEDIINVVIESNISYANMLNKSICFKVNVAGTHPNYNCNIVLSLMNNLVTNSVEAIDHSGIISISVDTKDDCLMIQVQDNGPGIQLKNRDLIFEPGYTTKFDSNGTASNGIGLPYIKELIKDFNGKIELYSDPKNRNTLFIIQLPIKNINENG